MMQFVRTFSIMRARRRLIAMKEVQNYGKIAQATSKTVSKMVGGRMHTLQVPQPYPPGSAPGHKLQKPSK